MTAIADVLLFAALAAIGGAALLARDLRACAILFIAFGLLLTLAWVRLAAPDVALAEAAIGAGVTGALLLDAAAQLGGTPDASPPDARRGRRALAFAVGTLCAGFAALLAGAAFVLPDSGGAAARIAADRLAETEIAHPVTAVLLAFRAYDTLLEIGVLLAAAVAGLALAAPAAAGAPRRRDPVLARVVAVTVPTAVLVALYLLWAGATRTGGAFQAGAVLAGALLLGRFAGARFDPIGAPGARRLALAAGFAVFLAVGVVAGLAAGALLAYPTGWGGALVLAIEAALTVSIAAGLVALFGPDAGR